MRKVAQVVRSSEIVKVMLYETMHGVYLYEYDMMEDGPAIADYLTFDINEAMEIAFVEFGIEYSDWYDIGDPIDNCLPDWIAPVRPYKYGTNHVDWNRLEILEEGKWREIVL